MARSLAKLPVEILQLIIANLTSEHHSIIVPLAQTYNKIIYAACSEVLKHRRSIPAAKRAICDVFHDEEYRPGWSRVFGDNLLDLSYLDLHGTLHWLDELACKLRDFDDFNEDEDESGLDDLILQTEAVGCQIPYAFVKFFKRYCYYERLFLMLQNGDHDQFVMPHLHKVHPREGATGYIIEFLCDDHGGNILCLYLDPGPTKSHALVWTHRCGFDNDRNKDDGDEYMKMFGIRDANGTLHKGCHDIGGSDMTFLCFDFETWLAGIMCYYACLHDTNEWATTFPPGSLRRTRFMECVAANPDLKNEAWASGVGEDVRAFLSNVNTSTAA